MERTKESTFHRREVAAAKREKQRLLKEAAPVMYEALREAEKYLTILAEYSTEGVPQPLLDSVRHALTQAKGA